MATLLLNGILLGLSLSIMVGPLLFAVVEASLSRGFRAGLAVAVGMWASDALYVLLIIFGLDAFSALTEQPHFRTLAGVGGGSMLCLFGLGSLFFARKNIPQTFHTTKKQASQNKKELATFFFKGFIINTINPGTIFFWLGVASAIVVPSRWSGAQTVVFFGAMLATLALTDALKAYAAKQLRKFLTPTHVQQVRRGIGLLLLAIGVVLIGRVL